MLCARLHSKNLFQNKSRRLSAEATEAELCNSTLRRHDMGARIGIDLGTTYCAVAYINTETGKPAILKNSYGDSITPSVLAFMEGGEILYGIDAKEQKEAGNPNTIAFFKKNMGRPDFRVEFWGKQYTATDLSAILLRYLIDEAERQLDTSIEGAVITVPAYFTHVEREATVQASKKAGINVLGIINEPTSAAFAYGINQNGASKKVLIYDLGGGTFDVTIAGVDDENINIAGTTGDHDLGGSNWDDCIYEYLANEFTEEFGIDPRNDFEQKSVLTVLAENLKKQLTNRNSVQAIVRYQGKTGKYTLTEEKFREISDYYMGITRDLCEKLLNDSGWTWGDIDGVILVGGSTRMKMVRDYVASMSGSPPLGGVNADEAVALGAAIRANIDEKGRIIASLPAGPSGEPLITLPGAKAIRDVIAHDLGMIAIDEKATRYINSILIKRLSPIPCEVTKPYNFSTEKGTNELEVYMLQGSQEHPPDCLILGKYVFYDIKYQKKGPAVIDITYSYNSNGMVEVSAVQTETGRKLPMRIEAVPGDMSWVDDPPPRRASPVEIILAVDLSGSMSIKEYGRTALEAAQEAAVDFINTLPEGMVRIGVMGFSDSTKVLLAPSGNRTDIEKAIHELRVGMTGGTNSAHPFDNSFDMLSHVEGQRYVVVLTDGCWRCTEAAVRSAQKCHQNGIDVIALGFGSANHAFLKRIASRDDLAEMTSVSDLSGAFGKIAQVISENPTLR